MKMYGHRAFILVLAMNFVSCDTNVSLTTKSVDFDPKVHVHAIGKDEKLPEGVRSLLEQQPHTSSSAVKFPVSYYLLQEPDAKFIYTKDFETRIKDQLIFIVSGEKYYKLFVHPDSDKMYSFLKRSYRYIGPNETEFVGSPITGDKTLVIWNSRNYYKKPFVVKTILNAQMLDDIRSRFPAQTIDPPEMASLLFKREIKGTNEKIEGQQVTAIPALP